MGLHVVRCPVCGGTALVLWYGVGKFDPRCDDCRLRATFTATAPGKDVRP